MLSSVTSFELFSVMVKMTRWLICIQFFESNQVLYAEDEFCVEWALIYSPPSSYELWLSEPEHWDRRKKIQVQYNHNEECQCFWIHHNPALMPSDSPPDVTATSDDDSNVNDSSHVKMSKSEQGIRPDNPKVADDGYRDCDCDFALHNGPKVVNPDHDP